MPSIHAQIRLGHNTRSFELNHKTITIGRGNSCVLRLHVPWLEDQHLIIDNSDELVRVRCAGPKVRARLSGINLATDWQVLPSPGRITILGPGDDELLLDLSYVEPKHNAVVLQGDAFRVANSGDGQAATTVTVSPLDQEGWQDPVSPVEAGAKAPLNTTAGAKAASNVKQRLLSKREYATIGIIFGILMIAMATVLYNAHRRSAAADLVRADTKWVFDHLAQAEESLQKKEYVAAKAALNAAEPVANKYDSLSAQRNRISELLDTNEIKLGAGGYVKMEGQWLPAKTASAWESARERDDPKIVSLEQKALDAQKAKELDVARLACEEALALMASHPVKPHPKEKALRTLLETVKNEAIASEMIAKGFVLHKNKWVTPQDKFKLEQIAKGLVEYRGKWVSKGDAFAAEQKDKGLVLHQGRWMSQDEKRTAEGFIQFEGKWIKPAEKTAIIAKRREEKRKEEQRLAAERKRLEEQRAQARLAAVKAEELKATAYLMSQVFVKKQLKAPASAVFQAYGSADVIVVLKDGWYIVKAVVDAQNAFGALLRKVYYSKLRPIAEKPGMWESESTFFSE